MSAIELNSASPKPWKIDEIAIAGAGVGGLALALLLAGRGVRAVMFDRRGVNQIRTEGAFLTLAPNGLNALKALGLAGQVAAAGIRTIGLALHNERGRRLAVVDYAGHEDTFGAPSVTIRRGTLGGILLDAAAAAGLDVRLGAEVTGIAEDAAGVTVTAGGEEHRFAAVVAADGLRSAVRRLAFPELPPPRFSGLIGTGGFVDIAEVAPTGGLMHMTFGRRAFFGYIKAPGEPVYWFNSYPAPESAGGPIADPAAYAALLSSLHRDDPPAAAAIVGAVRELDRHYPIYDMDSLPRWSSARIVLMGDAAHAVAPHSGQGAAMALEDAVVLASCLAAEPALADAFRRFTALRRERTEAAIRLGRFSGSQKHAKSWLALRLRDLVLPLVMPLGARAQARLFAHRADLDPLAVPAQ